MDTVISKCSISAIIATANRCTVLKRTLESLAKQHLQPREIIVIDASEDLHTVELLENGIEGLQSTILYKKALIKGAASQRNQGMKDASQDFILFMDDDILFEQNCIEKLWCCINSNAAMGGVNAMVTNQQYHAPGKATKMMYRFLSGTNLTSYAGKCIGPAWNLLPEDNPLLPEFNEVEWLNTTCTLYRKAALPTPLFDAHFIGYSLMEDLSLSLIVKRNWLLFNARTAKIFHDSQPGMHKSNTKDLAKMELVNRHYIMKEILHKNGVQDYCKLFIFQLFGILSSSTSRFSKNVWLGKIAAIKAIAKRKND